MVRHLGRLVAFGFSWWQAASAADKVYATIGMRSVLEELQPKFERASDAGRDHLGLAGALAKRVADGEPGRPRRHSGGIDGLIKAAGIAEGRRPASFALSGVGVSVRAGARSPISSPEKLKSARLPQRPSLTATRQRRRERGPFREGRRSVEIGEAVKARRSTREAAGLPASCCRTARPIWQSRRSRNCWKFRAPTLSACRETCRTSRRLQA